MKKRGFTLIELLVVIAIIAILATIVIINVTSARTKANDTKVLSEITAANRGAMACWANNFLPVNPINKGLTKVLAGSTFGPSMPINDATVSVCATPNGGLDAFWPFLNQGTGAYLSWSYSNAANGVMVASGNWNWSASSGTKIIIFTQRATTKNGF